MVAPFIPDLTVSIIDVGIHQSRNAGWTAKGQRQASAGTGLDSTTTSIPPEWVSKFDNYAARVAALKPGWDGKGSREIDPALLYNARRIVGFALSGLSEVVSPYIVPGADGSIQIEWHEERFELEFDMSPNGSASFWMRDHSTGQVVKTNDSTAAYDLFSRWAPRVATGLVNDTDGILALPPQFAPIAA